MLIDTIAAEDSTVVIALDKGTTMLNDMSGVLIGKKNLLLVWQGVEFF